MSTVFLGFFVTAAGGSAKTFIVLGQVRHGCGKRGITLAQPDFVKGCAESISVCFRHFGGWEDREVAEGEGHAEKVSGDAGGHRACVFVVEDTFSILLVNSFDEIRANQRAALNAFASSAARRLLQAVEGATQPLDSLRHLPAPRDHEVIVCRLLLWRAMQRKIPPVSNRFQHFEIDRRLNVSVLVPSVPRLEVESHEDNRPLE